MKTIVIYGGRFQPFHKGHKASYDALVQKFGAKNVYVASPNKATSSTDPFKWKEKQRIAKMMGVPAERFIAPKSVYSADAIKEVLPFNDKNTVLVVALSQKDGDRLIGSTKDEEGYALKKKGGRAAIQWLRDNPGPLAEGHIYVTLTPTAKFSVLGKVITSATQIRNMYANASDEQRVSILSDMYDKKPSKPLKKLFDKRLGVVQTESLIREFNEFIKKF